MNRTLKRFTSFNLSPKIFLIIHWSVQSVILCAILSLLSRIIVCVMTGKSIIFFDGVVERLHCTWYANIWKHSNVIKRDMTNTAFQPYTLKRYNLYFSCGFYAVLYSDHMFYVSAASHYHFYELNAVVCFPARLSVCSPWSVVFLGGTCTYIYIPSSEKVGTKTNCQEQLMHFT